MGVVMHVRHTYIINRRCYKQVLDTIWHQIGCTFIRGFYNVVVQVSTPALVVMLLTVDVDVLL